MKWKSITREQPPTFKEVWITFFSDGVITKQQQTYAKVVGKDNNNDLYWHDIVSGNVMDNGRFTVTHWMNTPDNPCLTRGSL